MVNHPNRSKKVAAAKPASARAPRVKPSVPDHDRLWAAFSLSVSRAERALEEGKPRPLFTTDADPDALYKAYLSGLPASERGVHTCHACERFIEIYGGVAVIDGEGSAYSALWGFGKPEPYVESVAKMERLVNRAKVTGVFLSKESIWGQPETKGGWTHLHVPSTGVFVDPLLTAAQAMAAKRENFRTVKTALDQMPVAALREILRLFEGEHLVRSERFVGPVRWLVDLHEARDAATGRARRNVIWRAIATAPEGYCHPRASVVAPILDAVVEGKPFSEIKRIFDGMMHPLRYQRPQAPPKAQNIAKAEKIVEALGIAPALERRYARLDEVIQHAIWVPRAQPPKNTGGVFDHLKGAGNAPAVSAPVSAITWVKFRDTVLARKPQAIDAVVLSSVVAYAMTTAADPSAPPILKWDREDERNPVAWYAYHGHRRPEQWNLSTGYVPVTAIVPMPNLWGSQPQEHLGGGVMLLLEGCADKTTGQGNALFPEQLRGELHEIRPTIEAHSKTAILGGRGEASACGLRIELGSAPGHVLRVTEGNAVSTYKIDRWD